MLADGREAGFGTEEGGGIAIDWYFSGRGVGECVLPPELEEEVSEFEPLLLGPAAGRCVLGTTPVLPAKASRDMLSKLASFLSGEGLPGR